MALHKIKIEPNSNRERRFMDILDSVGVNWDLVMCRRWYDFGVDYDEYIISEGLSKVITKYLIEREENEMKEMEESGLVA